jgi:PAS domain-containing protein
MTAKPKATGWLAENGPKELELRFRAFVFNPSAPILLIDDDRRCLEASIDAGKLLGLHPSRNIAGDSVRLRRPVWRVGRLVRFHCENLLECVTRRVGVLDRM